MIYQFYEILLIFAVYSVLGYVITVMWKQFNHVDNIRDGVICGPFCMAYGIGAVILAIVSQYNIFNPGLLFIQGVVIGTVVEFLAGKINEFISGKKKKFYKFYHSIFWGIMSVAAVTHWNNIIIAIIRYINPWINMIILLIVYINIVTGLVDGVSQLYDERKTCTKKLEAE